MKTGWLTWFSPDGSFDRGQNARVQVSYVDSWFEKASLNPHVMYLVELEGESDLGDELGHYFELGIKPQIGLWGELFSLSAPVSRPGLGGHCRHNVLRDVRAVR